MADKIKVAVRVRPFNKRELDIGGECIVSMEKSENGEITRCKDHTFTFDNSFWSFDPNDEAFSSQAEVFSHLGSAVVGNVMEGFNGTVFAYGQTGSGKTYSMMGTPEDEGLIPRLCQELFQRVGEDGDGDYKVSVETSYYEIYNEKVYDLLARRSKNDELRPLMVRNSPVLGPYVQGLSSYAVENYDMIDSLLIQGQERRHTAQTGMNDSSSRSHAVFVLKITQRIDDGNGKEDEDLEKTSRLNLVDLAGSERQTKTQTQGAQLQEGSAINKSLTTLGMVISALVKSNGQHVPYRDSALTWLLKESFGGNAKTIMIATISPSEDNVEETLSTLRFADNAKQITCKAVINEGKSARIIRELKEEIARLKAGGNHSNKGDQGDQGDQGDLAEAQNLLAEAALGHEEKLERTRREMEQRVHDAEQKTQMALMQAEEARSQVQKTKTLSHAIKWQANAHIKAVERKFSEKSIGETPDYEELKRKLSVEKMKAEELQKQLDLLQTITEESRKGVTEFEKNQAELVMLKKLAQVDVTEDDRVGLTEQLNNLNADDLRRDSIFSTEIFGGATGEDGTLVETMPFLTVTTISPQKDGDNPYNPFTVETDEKPQAITPDVPRHPKKKSLEIEVASMPREARTKLLQMQSQLTKAKSALAAAKKGKTSKQGQQFLTDLLLRRRALFALSRGLKPKGQVCLRSYVIMTCKAAAQVLQEGPMHGSHGCVRLSNIACAGYLQKKGGMRHNWNTRWFLFDLRHRKVIYFTDVTLKKECGFIPMPEVLSCISPPRLDPRVMDPERVSEQKLKFLVVTPKRTWQFMAPTQAAKELWMAVFTSIISEESKVREVHNDIAGDYMS